LQPEVRDFEPRLALDAGSDGLDLLRRVVAGARERLVPGGVLAVEVGAGQAGAVAALFEAAGFADLGAHRDYGRIERVVSGVLRS
jgi:release factor glutamine methyltransferase